METDTAVYLYNGTRLGATEEGSADVCGSSNGPNGDAEGQKTDEDRQKDYTRYSSIYRKFWKMRTNLLFFFFKMQTNL